MVYLVNLSEDNYLSGKVPQKEAIEAAATLDGKFPATIIPYSVEHEQNQPNSSTSQVHKIIQAAYDEL